MNIAFEYTFKIIIAIAVIVTLLSLLFIFKSKIEKEIKPKEEVLEYSNLDFKSLVNLIIACSKKSEGLCYRFTTKTNIDCNDLKKEVKKHNVYLVCKGVLEEGRIYKMYKKLDLVEIK